MRDGVKLVLLLLTIPLYIGAVNIDVQMPCQFLNSGTEPNVSGSDVEDSGVDLSDSTSTCEQMQVSVRKKYFGLVKLPVHKFGYNIEALHYAYFFTVVGSAAWILIRDKSN